MTDARALFNFALGAIFRGCSSDSRAEMGDKLSRYYLLHGERLMRAYTENGSVI